MENLIGKPGEEIQNKAETLEAPVEFSPRDEQVKQLQKEIAELDAKYKDGNSTASHLIDLKGQLINLYQDLKKLEKERSIILESEKPKEDGPEKDAYVKNRVMIVHSILALESDVSALNEEVKETEDKLSLELERPEKITWGETAPTLMNYQEAVEWAKKISHENLAEYKIPTIEELEEAYKGAIVGFNKDNSYLSSTESTEDLKIEDRNHWALDFNNGKRESVGKAFPLAIRVVRK